MIRTRAEWVGALLLLLIVIAVPSRTDALEIRRGGAISVPAGETIDDTIAMFGESVAIDGRVTGDAIAFARSVIVRGDVDGDLIAFAETVTIEGEVMRNVFGFGASVTLSGAQVGRNLYGFGREVSAGTGSEIRGNASMFAASTFVRGNVGVDLTSFGQNVEVSGEITRNVEAHADTVTILDPARIGGNVTAHIGAEANLETASGATIGGTVDARVDRDAAERRNQYLTASFYVRQAIRLGAAFLAGLIAFWLFPSLVGNVTLGSSEQAVKSVVAGLFTLIGLPIASVIACVTIIGIPLGIIGLLAWVVGIYFAKIVLALVVGRALFGAAARSGPAPHHAAMLLAGLVVIVIAINLPYVGGVLNFVLTVVGLGLIASHVLARVQRVA
jgi:cytoskeletal protein CcmA (bactofilin family)